MKYLVLLTTAMLILFGCQNEENDTDLNLNDGKKWIMNSDMTPPIKKGIKIVEEYISTGDTDHVQLAKNLSTHNKNLIQSCTMHGEAHDQLHTWLVPHMELVDELGEASGSDEAEKIVVQIKESFDTYQTYFE